jgi:hypothetical protein
MRVVSLLTLAVLAGCGAPPESDSLSAWIYEDGAVSNSGAAPSRPTR